MLGDDALRERQRHVPTLARDGAANPFDFGSIADVLVTVDYTALDDVDLRARVVAGLDRRMAGSRALSLRHDFPDAWYELNNPQLIEDPVRRMVVTVI
jgi:hypothetical protein